MTTNTWARCASRYDLAGGDADLDQDLQAWHAPAGPAARVGLLDGVHVRAPGRAPRRPARALVVLEVLALRPHGTTTRQLLQAPSPRDAGVTASGLPEMLAGLGNWLGRDPTGRDRLQCAHLPTGEGVYRLTDVLVDVDLFRRLRLRGAARGPAGAADLRAARELLPRAWPAHLPDSGEAGGPARTLCAAAAADLTRRLDGQAAPPSSGGAGGPSIVQKRVPQPAAGQPGPADVDDVRGSEASPEQDNGFGNRREWRPGSRCPGVFLLPQLGQPRPGQCVRHGGDVDSTGALLTLADLERHLPKPAPAPTPDVPAAPGRPAAACSPLPRPGWTPPPLDGEQVAGPALYTARPDRPHPAGTDVTTDLERAAPPAASPGRHRGADRPVPRTPRPPTATAAAIMPQPAATPIGPTAAVTVSVLATHGGAGASTVALALADAAAARGLPVHLIAAAGGGGLEGVADAELGEDLNAGWRTGRRGRHVTVHHDLTRIGGRPRLPLLPGRGGGLVVLDLGPGATNAADGTVHDSGLLVVVARASVPGLRAAELLLGALPAADEAPGAARRVLVTVGPARWPGVVATSAGPGVRAMREHDRWVPVPLDRALTYTGVSSRPLPQPVLHAARAVLRHLPPPVAAPGGPGAQGASPATPAVPAAVGGQR